MSVDIREAKLVDTIKDTPGGSTYVVLLPKKTIEKAICYRKIHGEEFQRCTNPAGYGTWHPGTGACKFHGGATEDTGRITTGRTARMTKLRLADKIQEYLNQDRDKLLDLSEQLAAAKVIYNEFIETMPIMDIEDDDNQARLYNWLYRFEAMINSMGNLVEKISRTDSRNTLTAAQVMYLRAVVADILMKYITNPDDRDRAARELANRMGGDVEDVEMKRSEFVLPKGA